MIRRWLRPQRTNQPMVPPIMSVLRGHGAPVRALAFSPDGLLLATIAVPQQKGKPKSRPRQLIADKGYDSRKLRQALHQRGIRPCIPPKRRPANWKPRQGRPVKAYTEEYRHRWPVERTFAWLGHQRRLLVRHEHKADNFHAFFTLACIRLTLAVLLR